MIRKLEKQYVKLYLTRPLVLVIISVPVFFVSILFFVFCLYLFNHSGFLVGILALVGAGISIIYSFFVVSLFTLTFFSVFGIQVKSLNNKLLAWSQKE